MVGIGTSRIIGVVGGDRGGVGDCSCVGLVGGTGSTFCSLIDGAFVTVMVVGDGMVGSVGKNDDDGAVVGVRIVILFVVGGLAVVVTLTVGAGSSLLLLPLVGSSRLLVAAWTMSDVGLLLSFTTSLLLPPLLLPFLLVRVYVKPTITITNSINIMDTLT
jgi:hypothetical protein